MTPIRWSQAITRSALGQLSDQGLLAQIHLAVQTVPCDGAPRGAPDAAGGETSANNLELRCRGHSQYEAEKYFGPLQAPLVREERAIYSLIASSFRYEVRLGGSG
jgi:hypothetical protein